MATLERRPLPTLHWAGSLVRRIGDLPPRIENARLTAAIGLQVVQIDTVPVSGGDVIEIAFEHADIGARHGVWAAVDGELEVAGMTSPQVTLWADTAPAIVRVRIEHTVDSLLRLHNVWDDGRGIRSQAATSGMLVEALAGDATRYRCMDYGLEPKFNALVFTVRRRTGTSHVPAPALRDRN